MFIEPPLFPYLSSRQSVLLFGITRPILLLFGISRPILRFIFTMHPLSSPCVHVTFTRRVESNLDETINKSEDL